MTDRKASEVEKAPDWNGVLHLGKTDPIRIERDVDDKWHVYTGCCQCRLIHHLVIEQDNGALLLDFRLPPAEAVSHIEGARVEAESGQIEKLQDELAAVREEQQVCPDVDELAAKLHLKVVSEEMYGSLRVSGGESIELIKAKAQLDMMLVVVTNDAVLADRHIYKLIERIVDHCRAEVENLEKLEANDGGV